MVPGVPRRWYDLQTIFLCADFSRENVGLEWMPGAPKQLSVQGQLDPLACQVLALRRHQYLGLFFCLQPSSQSTVVLVVMGQSCLCNVLFLVKRHKILAQGKGTGIQEQTIQEEAPDRDGCAQERSLAAQTKHLLLLHFSGHMSCL